MYKCELYTSQDFICLIVVIFLLCLALGHPHALNKLQLNQTFRVNHEFARISLKQQFVYFLNHLSESSSRFLNKTLENVYIQSFIGFSRFI